MTPIQEEHNDLFGYPLSLMDRHCHLVIFKTKETFISAFSSGKKSIYLGMYHDLLFPERTTDFHLL